MIKSVSINFGIIVLLFLQTTVFSQTNGGNSDDGASSTFENKTQQGFNEYVQQLDKEFSNYLEENFNSYRVKSNKQKAESKEVLKQDYKKAVIADYVIKSDIDEYAIAKQTAALPVIKKSESDFFSVQQISLEFLGHELTFDVDSAFSFLTIGKPTAKDVSSIWAEMSELNYNHYLNQVSETADVLNLNQWGFFQLLKICSEQLYLDNHNMQILFQWAMLNRSQYNVKLGFDSDHLFLLMATLYDVENIDYVDINGIKYYIIAGKTKSKKLQTYKNDFPNTEMLMDLSIKSPMNTIAKVLSKDFHFDYNDKSFNISLDFDEQLFQFYQTVPLSEGKVYLNSVVGNNTKKSIIESFSPILKGKTSKESLNILLSFVQYVCKNESSSIRSIGGKHHFHDYVLFHSSANNEQRSVLLAYLIKTLLQKDFVALKYSSNHLLAVNMGDSVKGAYIIYKNKPYIVADPNYLDAPLGVAKPNIKNKKAVIYYINSEAYSTATIKAIWNKIYGYGGLKADKMNKDLVFDKDGNIYVCGYFKESARFDDYIIEGEGKGMDVFIAKFDADLQPLWVKAAIGKGNDMAYELILHENKALYVYGCFEKNLSFSSKEIKARNGADVFVAKYNTEGDCDWVRKASIDSIVPTNEFVISVKFHPNGNDVSTTFYNASEYFHNYGLNVDKEGDVTIVASFIATTGLSDSDYYVSKSRGGPIDVATELYNANLLLIDKEYETTIAGVFAALNFLSENTLVISSRSMKRVLDSYSMKLKMESEEIYNNLLKMSFLKNESGIITIKTIGEEAVIFDKIKVENNAKIKIVKYKSGNILVQIISSVYVGSQSNWLDLNSVKLFKSNGNLLLDYDIDNSKKQMNLKKEILKY